MMLKIVASLTDDSRGIIYDCNIFIIKATAGAAAAASSEIYERAEL